MIDPNQLSPADRAVWDRALKSGFDERMAELEDRHAAFICGWDQGYAAGRNDRSTDAEAMVLHQAAAEVVTRMAGFPEHDAEADKAAALRRANSFGQPLLKAGAR